MPRSYLGYVNHQFTSCAWKQASHLDAVTEAVRWFVNNFSTAFENESWPPVVKDVQLQVRVIVLDDSDIDTIHFRTTHTEVRKDLGNGSKLCQDIERHGSTHYLVDIPKMGRCKKANYNAPCYTAKLKVACKKAMSTAEVVKPKDSWSTIRKDELVG
jgi:hypothetical protein|tara:strand:+ start:2078 stop:2548 length:471 start_codon:yes stop_codon:yes gene_type:complete